MIPKRIQELELSPTKEWSTITFKEHSGQEDRLTRVKYEGERYRKVDGKRLGKFKRLEVLTILNTSIRKLPPAFGQLKRLTKLSLASNELEFLPPEIGKLESLTALHAPWNKLESLPIELGSLPNLQELFLTDNRLCPSTPSWRCSRTSSDCISRTTGSWPFPWRA